MEPNKKNIKKWVDNLRSGKYKKTKGFLKFGDCYCIMGVACDVSNLYEWKKENNSYREFYGETESLTWPGEEILEYYGLEDEDLVFNFEDKVLNIVYLNDSLDLSFKKIADLIEGKFL